jgi:hypothetical protein
MSGPKVVRVVTREELVAAGEAVLRQLDAAVSQWQMDCAVAGVQDADVQKTKQRRDQLEAMLRQDKFAQFGTAAASEIDYLDADASSRRERAAQARAQERMRTESGRQIAQTLLRSLSASSQQLRQELERVAAGKSTLAEMDQVLTRARQELYKDESADVTPEQSALAGRLARGESGQSLEAWKRNALSVDARVLSMFAHLAELESLGDAEVVAGLNASLEQAQSLDAATRQMRLDSLLFSIRAAKESAQSRASLLRNSRLLVADLAGFEEATEVVEQLKRLSMQTPPGEMQLVILHAQEELASLKASHAAASRRRSMLDGLSKLGYQVHEGLSTATTTSGRLLVRDPSRPAYGVEILGAGAMEKIQVRTVAFDVGRDMSMDIPEEQRWCGDFGKLRAALHSQGCEVVVEKALGVGAVPVKVVAAVEAAETRRVTMAPKALRKS